MKLTSLPYVLVSFKFSQLFWHFVSLSLSLLPQHVIAQAQLYKFTFSICVFQCSTFRPLYSISSSPFSFLFYHNFYSFLSNLKFYLFILWLMIFSSFYLLIQLIVYIHYFYLLFHIHTFKQPYLGKIWYDKHINLQSNI